MSNQLEERLRALGTRLPELDEATAERVLLRVVPPRRRRWPRLLLAVPVVAAAVALAVLLWPSSNPDVLSRAYAALAIPPHSILHERIVETNSLGCRQVVESWIATRAPYWYRTVTTGQWRSEEGLFDGHGAFYDQHRGVVVQSPFRHITRWWTPQSLTFAQRIRQLLAQGEGRVIGRAIVGGHEVYRIEVPTGDPKPLVIATDVHTFQPVQFARTLPYGGHTTSTTELWEYVPDTAANRPLLSVTAQHPGARVERTPDERAYSMAQTRAGGAECG